MGELGRFIHKYIVSGGLVDDQEWFSIRPTSSENHQPVSIVSLSPDSQFTQQSDCLRTSQLVTIPTQATIFVLQCKVLVENLKGRDQLQDHDIDGRISNYLRGAGPRRFITAFTTAEPVEYNPQSPASLPKIHSDPFLPSTPWSYEWSLSLGFSHQNPVHFSLLSHACHMPCKPLLP
jgi:hypothetical protein